MTTVRMPVRVRLELDPDRPRPELSDLVQEATGRAAARAAERALRVPVVCDSAWHDGPPDVTVRFTGDPLPERLAADLAAGAHTSVQTAAVRLRQPAKPVSRQAAPARGRAVRLRFRSFSTLADMWMAVLDHYGGPPSGPVLVVALDDEQQPRGWIMTATGEGELPLVEDIGEFQEWTVPQGVAAAQKGQGSALPVDQMRFRWRANTKAERQELLTRAYFDDLVGFLPRRTAEDDNYVRQQVAKKVALFPWTGSVAIYEFLSGGSHVRWFEGPPGITSGTLDVLMLIEEVTSGNGGGYGEDCPPLDISSADEAELDEPYLGEPSLAQWPGDYDSFARQIRDIADRLRIPAGIYVGSFALCAMSEIVRQCALAGLIETTLARQDKLRSLSELVVLVNNLAVAYIAAMIELDRAKALPCPVAGHSGTWTYHFNDFLTRSRRKAVAELFGSACQDALLEALENSAFELDRRLNEFPRYMQVTRAVVVIMLSQSVELEDLRREIQNAKIRDVDAAMAYLPRDWRQANADVIAAIRGEGQDRMPAGSVAFANDEYWAKDAGGHWWSERQLSLAIGAARHEVLLVDPLLEKISHLDDIVRRLQDAQRRNDQGVVDAVDKEFSTILYEIKKTNEDLTKRVRRDRSIAFGLASFTDDRTDEIGARFVGIHRLADERLRAMFPFQELYVDGMRALAGSELGKADLAPVLELVQFAGLVALGMFCPPAAFLVGAAQAVSGLVSAYEHRDLQRAILDGDEIISRAQVEAELWVAWIGAALQFLPEVPKVGRFASRVLPGAERRVAAIAATRAAEEVARRTLAAATTEALFGAFARELVNAYVTNLVLSRAIDDFVQAIVSDDVPPDVSPAELRSIMAEAVRASNAAREGS